MQYLVKHRDTFYFKKKLPKTQKNLVLSLQTDNKHEANFIIAIISTRLSLFLKDFQLTNEEEIDHIQKTVKQYIEEAKADYGTYADIREDRYKYTNKKGIELLGSHPKSLEKAIQNLTDMLYSSNKATIYAQIIENSPMKTVFDSTFEALSAQNKIRFQDEVIKGEIELLHLDKERNKQRVTTVPNTSTYLAEDFADLMQSYFKPHPDFNNNSIPTHINQTVKTEPKERYYEKTAQEIFVLFIQSKIEKDKITDPQRYATIIKVFLELTDKKYLIDISHDDIDQFYEDVLCLPDQNKHIKLYKEHTYKEIIAMVKKQALLATAENITEESTSEPKETKLRPVAESTTANKLINLGAYLDYAVNYEYLDKNRLTDKVNLTTEGDDDIRKEFYSSQLNSLFTSDWYSTQLISNLKTYPSKVWIPLILLFQGCRSNEIAQIYVDQIVIKDDIHFFKIEAQYPDQKLKNRTSRRTIPIHPALIELGFLKFLEAQRAKGCTRLFDELYFTKNKGYAQAFSKHFNNKAFKNKWLDDATMKLLETKEIMLDLHSFRHNFSGSLKGLIEDGLLDYFTGHTKKSESQGRYGNFRPQLQFEMISKCAYPNLDLSALKTKLDLFYAE